MEGGVQVLTEETIPSQLICLKEGPVKIEETSLIVEAAWNGEV